MRQCGDDQDGRPAEYPHHDRCGQLSADLAARATSSRDRESQAGGQRQSLDGETDAGPDLAGRETGLVQHHGELTCQRDDRIDVHPGITGRTGLLGEGTQFIDQPQRPAGALNQVRRSSDRCVQLGGQPVGCRQQLGAQHGHGLVHAPLRNVERRERGRVVESVTPAPDCPQRAERADTKRP